MATLKEVESQIEALQQRQRELDANVIKNGVFDGDVISAQGNVAEQIRVLQSRRVKLLSGFEDSPVAKLEAPAAPTPSQLRPPRWVTSNEARATATEIHAQNVETAKLLPLDTPQADILELYATESHVALVEDTLRKYQDEIVENGRACEFSEGLYAAIVAMLWRASSTTAATFCWAGNQRRLLEERVAALESAPREPFTSAQLQMLAHYLTPEICEPLLKRIEDLERRPSMEYAGIWDADKKYEIGNVVTDRGSMFVCRSSTQERPGESTAGSSASSVAKTAKMDQGRNKMRNTRLSNLAVNRQADALASQLDNGFIEVYEGEQPSRAEAAVSSEQKLLVSCKFGDPAFRPAISGVLIANPIYPGVAIATGKPTWARVCQADRTPVMSVSAGTRDAALILPVPTIEVGTTLSIDFTHTIPKAAPGS